MNVSGKTHLVSSVVAALCILIYIAAIAFGAVRIIINMGDRRNHAKAEFDVIADRAASSAVFLGFMSEAYQETIRDFLHFSNTPILGIIITGPAGEYAFEREPGSGLVWSGNNPRLKTGIGYPREPFHLPLRIEGQRNVNIYAVYSNIDYDFFLNVLRDTLLAVLFTLAAALITLIIELIFKHKSPGYVSRPAARTVYREAASAPAAAPPEQESPGTPRGLFTPRGNIGWESYIHDRLESELHRCASSEKDLTFLVMEFPGRISNDLYRKFAEETVSFFSMRDLVFEKGEKGISVIVPDMDLDTGMIKAEEFFNRIISRMPESFNDRSLLRIGLSSRSGRLIDAERFMREADAALEKAAEDSVSPITAFRSDPDKYREFVKRHPPGIVQS